MQNRPFLILAQSGRFLAESLQYTGCPIWVADCFGDSDTLAASTRWQPLNSFSALNETTLHSTLKQLSQGQSCFLICGTGIEILYPYLRELPKNISLLGNTAVTVEQVKTPEHFFNLLNQLDIPFPETVFTRPEEQDGWLKKAADGLGATHIQLLGDDITHLCSSDYYQRFELGISGSGLFVANGKTAVVLSYNRHYYVASDDLPFRLNAIDNSLLLTASQQQALISSINKLTQSCELTGLNSIDFIISQSGCLLITEINPRPSASVELLPKSINPLKLHIDACRGLLPDRQLQFMQDYKSSLFYHYTNETLTIPSNVDWPKVCHDIPLAKTVIDSQHIVCSSVMENCHYSDVMHHSIELEIFSQFDRA